MNPRGNLSKAAIVRKPLAVAVAFGISCAASNVALAQAVDLSDLDGSKGFVINGIDAGDLSGFSVSAAGDVDGDGFDDVIIGADLADPGGNSRAGESYVVLGRASGFAASLHLSTLNGSNGFILNGIDPFDDSGFSVSAAGDVNGDGFDDVIIGAYGAESDGKSRAGESYVVFGRGSGFAPSLDLSTLDGTNGFTLKGIDSGDFSGYSVSAAGDVNGDGFDDVIIGAYRAGESYVVFGRGSGFPASLDLSTLDGTSGFALNGVSRSGRSVSGAGDFNGDGFDDVIIGADLADAGGETRAGQSYVVFGRAGGFGPSINLSTLGGSDGFVLNGVDFADQSGYSVSGAGDVNGDGFDDVIIGAWRADPHDRSYAGESYVVFGRAGGFAAEIDLSTLNGITGFVLNGVNALDRSGHAVSVAGDVNGDGFDDIIIGAAHGDDPGESYVVYGGSSFSGTIELSALDGNNGFVLRGIAANDRSGGSVGGAGDVNGDGFDDVIIGAYLADPSGNINAGETYVVFGSATPLIFSDGFE